MSYPHTRGGGPGKPVKAKAVKGVFPTHSGGEPGENNAGGSAYARYPHACGGGPTFSQFRYENGQGVPTLVGVARK